MSQGVSGPYLFMKLLNFEHLSVQLAVVSPELLKLCLPLVVARCSPTLNVIKDAAVMQEICQLLANRSST